MKRGLSSNVDMTFVRQTIAPLRNVAELCQLIERCGAREVSLPGMAVFYGPSGFGKSSAAAYATGKYNALLVQMQSLWTAKKFATAMAIEAGQVPRGSAADIVEQVSEHLATTRRPLIIDEADYLLRRGMIEIARDIYEASNAPVIMIGEELLPGKLKQWERIDGRLIDRVAAQPGERSDVVQLAKIYARDLRVPDELVDRILEESCHSIRRISVNLATVSEYARTNGLTEVTGEHFAPGAFTSGSAPAPRQTLADETVRGHRRAAG